MVTVVPTFNRGASIGQAIGQGLQGAVPIAQQQLQRSQLQQGLQEALSNMSPEMRQRLEPTIGILSAFSGIPGNERALATLLPEILREQDLHDQRRAPPPGAPPPGINAASTAGGARPQSMNVAPQQRSALPGFLGRNPQAQPQASQEELQSIVSQLSGQRIEPQGTGSLIPPALGEGINLGPKYTPQQIFENPRAAEAMQKYNQNIDEEARGIESRSEAQSDRANARREFQDNRRKFFEGKAPQIKGRNFDTLMRIADAPTIQSLPSFDAQFDKAIRHYDLLDKGKHDLKRLAVDRYDPENFHRNYKTMEHSIKPMIDAGMRNEMEGFIPSELGLGPVNTENLINPTSKGLYESSSNLPSYDEYMHEIASLPDYAPKEEYEKLEKQKEKMDLQWRSWLKKNIKPGKFDTKDPNGFKLGQSLLSARDIADQNGMNWQMFNRMVNDMADKGELDLDERQRGELSQLARPPEQLEGWAELLFGLGQILKITPKLKKMERRR